MLPRAYVEPIGIDPNGEARAQVDQAGFLGEELRISVGAGSRTRTGTGRSPGDFKSPMSTNSIIPASRGGGVVE